jgi:hypothetical protein
VATSGIEAVAESSRHFSFRLMAGGRCCEMRHGFQPMGRATTISCCVFGGEHVVNGVAKREWNTDSHVKVPR